MPLKKALAWIFLSALLTLATVGGALSYWNSLRQAHALDSHYNIVAIVQACTSSEPLQTDFLAQVLDLSIDQPTNLHRFNAKMGEEKLMACPMIKSAKIKKIKPSMIYVEYALRKPMAYLSEYQEAAIDEEGVVFPWKPFFTPKKIYELTLGLPADLQWGTKVSGKKMLLVQQLLEKIAFLDTPQALNVKKIDVSNAFSKKWGSREIVLFLEEGTDGQSGPPFMTVVRLSPKNWREQLENYPLLQPYLKRLDTVKATKNSVVDMRLSRLAFIGNAF